MADAATLPLLLRQLRLASMARHVDDVREQATQQGWGLEQTLATLCEHELAERERRRLERHLKEARLPPGKTLASFDCEVLDKAVRSRLTALATDTTWVTQAHNLLLFGPSGVGKSHMAAAIGHALIEQGLRVRLYAASTLVQELQSAKQELRLSEALGKLDKYDLLVIDDIGYVKRSEAETSVLFELIAHRYEAGSLLITANQPFSAWDTIFPDDMMAVAAIDRLVHHAQVIELGGESYRKRHHTQTYQEGS
ncbi:DNA replication protein DnaC [Thiohalospira halophila DSM 15071]|uniref:DNA replication protein DnaC n=1 Tax=Thiohalospira halophila DSM 15071 TaxID=1123397 RepID=A0A1I1N6M5_9GAMM|nr:IS21-like element helper ATPase IstB [Thiohalospira halophila]SFC91128.1 DNA replication protein DnaC [Thiohalospira halophila DSM 15071]